MKTRMNLFRQLEAPKPKLTAPKDLKLGFHAIAALSISGVSLLLIAYTYFNQRSKLSEIHAKQDQLQKDLAAITIESERLANEIAQRKREQLDKSSKKSSGPVISERLDPTWSAIIWKLSAFTGTRISIRSMDMSLAGPSRTLALNGSAASLPSLREWMDLMIRAVPGYDFSIESNANGGGDKDFPVSFRITARAL